MPGEATKLVVQNKDCLMEMLITSRQIIEL